MGKTTERDCGSQRSSTSASHGPREARSLPRRGGVDEAAPDGVAVEPDRDVPREEASSSTARSSELVADVEGPQGGRDVEDVRRALAGRSTVSRSTATASSTATSTTYARDVILTRGVAGVREDRGAVRRAESRRPRAAPAAQADPGEHALVERRRSDAGAAHRPDLPGDQQERPLVDSARGRRSSGDADLPEGLAAAGRGGAGVGEDRGREPVDARRHADRHREHVPRRRRPVVAGDQLVDPDALQLWFDLAAADYALKTEQDAASRSDAAFTYNIGSTLGATPTFAQFLTAVGAGASAVYTNSGRQADTLYMAADRFWYMFGLTSTRSRSSRRSARQHRAAEDRACARPRRRRDRRR
jgi:hypothetical protein